MTVDVKLGGAKKTKTGEQQRQPKDEESDERFWRSLPNLPGDQPSCVSDLGRKGYCLSQPPLIAEFAGFRVNSMSSSRCSSS